MDPKDNTTIPSTENQDQPTDQQRADGELVVSHEADLDTDSTNQNATGSVVMPTDPTAAPGDASNLNMDLGSVDLGPEAPTDQFAVPAAPVAPATPVSPLNDQPAPPLQPFSGDLASDPAASQPQEPAQPDTAQPFPPATPDPFAPVTPGTPGVVAPSAPVDPSAPAAPLTDSTTPAGLTEPKNKAMVLGLVLLAALVIVGLGIYALMAM